MSTKEMGADCDATVASAMPSREDIAPVPNNPITCKNSENSQHIDTCNSDGNSKAATEVIGSTDNAATTEEASESACDVTSLVASKDLSASLVGGGQSIPFDIVLPEEGSRYGPKLSTNESKPSLSGGRT